MAHEAAGLSIATNVIQPLNVSGGSDHTNGKIVLLSIGMSNTTDEWASLGTSNFLHLATLDPAKNPRVVIVDGAQGGQDATKWTNGSDATWSTVLQRLTTAGVSTNQVQAISRTTIATSTLMPTRTLAAMMHRPPSTALW